MAARRPSRSSADPQQNRLSVELLDCCRRARCAGLDPRRIVTSPAAIAQLPPAVHDAVLEALARSIHVTFCGGAADADRVRRHVPAAREPAARDRATLGSPMAEGAPLE